MSEPRLLAQLSALENLRRQTRLWKSLTICWFVIAILLLGLRGIAAITGWHIVPPVWSVALVGVVAAMIIWARVKRRSVDLRRLVVNLEREHPELHPLLTTAFEQEPDSISGRFGFLQLRVIDQVLAHRQRHVWEQQLKRKLNSAKVAHVFGLVALLLILVISESAMPRSFRPPQFARLIVDPGDVEVERGRGLVITARFARQPPAEATLVMLSASGQTRRTPLERHLADPVFGTSLPEVMENNLYRVEYGKEKSRDYKIAVFEYPALTRADATLRYPEFTGLTNKTIPDTLRVSAVEGTRLSYAFQLNKPVVRARLVGKEATIPLTIQSNAMALLNELILTNSGRYSLQLVDADGRTNKSTTDIVLQALPDRRPDLKLAFPQGDQRVSSLQELQLQAEVSDDFGLLQYGFGFGIAGEEPKLVESGKAATANDKRKFSQMIAMEKLGVTVDQLISYFVWADDYGPDGKVRRTYSDMFFAEVRPFEEIFRQDQSGAAEGANQGQGESQGQGNQSARLSELQKQIVIATWKLQREKGNAANVMTP